MINEEDNKQRFIANSNDYKFTINGMTENVAEYMQQRKNDELANAMKKFMPIGSVVKIKGVFKNYMIIGFNYQLNSETYDYMACEYPFGVDSNHQNMAFNHSQIDKVYHIGFVNNQEKSFKADLIGSNKKCEREEEER